MVGGKANDSKLISVLVPCYNEERYIAKCLYSVFSFDIPPKVNIEILVLDGGSTDNTVDIIKELMIKHSEVQLIHNPMKYQANGLNLGISLAKGDFIMRLDAHTIYPQDYLQNCYEISIKTGADNVGGICTTKAGDSSFSAALIQAVTTHRFGVGNSGFRVGVEAGYRDTVPFGFFKKDIFSRVGGFNEKLVRTQDYELNKRIVKEGGGIYLDPKIKSEYFNLTSLVAFLRKQLQLQGPYNVYMWSIAPYTFNFRHAATGLFFLYLSIGLAIASLNSGLYILWLVVLSLYMVLGVYSSFQQARRFRNPWMVPALPVVFFFFHLMHGFGMWIGLTKIIFGVTPFRKERKVSRGK